MVMTIGNLEVFGGDSKADADDGPQSRWIRVSVAMFEHEMLAGGPYDRRSAWLWLIANATWKAKKVRHKGRVMTLERGQLLAGRAYLAQQWEWSEQSVRTFIAQLANQSMLKINQSGGHFANVITICNYDTYQRRAERDGQSGNQSPPENQPVINQTLTKVPVLEDNNTASCSTPRAREDELERQLFDACNGSLDNPVNCQGLLNLAVPMMWLESGADLERDVLPTLKAIGRQRHGKRIRSWDYFTKPVLETRDKRLAGLPQAAEIKAEMPKQKIVYDPAALRMREEAIAMGWEPNA